MTHLTWTTKEANTTLSVDAISLNWNAWDMQSKHVHILSVMSSRNNTLDVIHEQDGPKKLMSLKFHSVLSAWPAFFQNCEYFLKLPYLRISGMNSESLTQKGLHFLCLTAGDLRNGYLPCYAENYKRTPIFRMAQRYYHRTLYCSRGLWP